VQYNTPVNGQVTLILSDIDVPTGSALDIEYETLALAYDIQQYVGTGIILDTKSHITNNSPSENTITLTATGTWVDQDTNLQPVTTPITKTTQPFLVYDTFTKSVNGSPREETVVIGDTVLYTLTLTAAENVRYMSGTIIQDILPDGLAFQPTSLNISNPNIALTSNTTNGEGLTTIVFTLTTGSIAPGSSITISYDVLVDHNFEGGGDDEYENTEEITNTANFSGIIGDSGQSQEW
jgi:fimbrial isopeptide formation D2 family protein